MKTNKTDSELKTRVLLEEIRQNVKVIAEGHGAIIKKLEGHDRRFAQIDQRFGRIEMDVESIKSKVGTIDIKVDRIERELGTVKDAMLDISGVLKGHDKRIVKLENKAFA